MANTSKSVNVQSAVNLVRQSMSTPAQNLLPKVGANTPISEISNPLMQYNILMNEFATGLINVIGMTVLDTVTNFTNKLSKYKGRTSGLGIDVREIATGIVNGQNYDFSVDGIAKMFKLYPQEYAECFHRLNRQRMFPITFSEKELKLALNSWDDLSQFINNLTNTLYQSNYIEEYEDMMLVLKSSFQEDGIKKIVGKEVVDEVSAKDLVNNIMDIADSFEFADRTNSPYGIKHPDTNIIPVSNKEDISIIVPYKIRNRMKLDVLLMAFNKDEVAFNVDTLTTVDDLGYIKDTDGKFYKVDALVCDKNYIRFYDDDDNGMNGNDLPTVRGYNRYLHIWQTLSTSPFFCANLVVHEVQSADIPAGYFDTLIPRTNG